MSKPPLVPSTPLIAKVRDILQSKEPRKFPTDTAHNKFGHICWVCPYCSELCRRKDRYVYVGPRAHKGQRVLVDYSSYNSHFAAKHGTPFWKEEQIVKLMEKEFRK